VKIPASLWIHKANLALQALGLWGLGGMAIVDSAAIPMPLDAVLIKDVAENHGRFLIYCLIAAAGSAVGSLVPYYLGRAGGELFLLKRINRQRYEHLRDRFEKQEFLAMAIPSALPPPTPWKACVFAAGVFEMRVVPFMLAVFTGRLVRWLILSLLVIKLGPGAVDVVQHHALTVLLAVGGIALIGFTLWWRRKRKSGEIPRHPLSSN